MAAHTKKIPLTNAATRQPATRLGGAFRRECQRRRQTDAVTSTSADVMASVMDHDCTCVSGSDIARSNVAVPRSRRGPLSEKHHAPALG
jgi:hypothetical protein